MGIRATKVFEYDVECDRCGRYEYYHTNDEDNGIRVHSITSAMKAARFHKTGKEILCPICWENHIIDRR